MDIPTALAIAHNYRLLVEDVGASLHSRALTDEQRAGLLVGRVGLRRIETALRARATALMVGPTR